MATAYAGPDLPLYRFPAMEAVKGIKHGVTTRHGGVSRGTFGTLNLSLSVQDDPEAVVENRRRVAAAFGASDADLLTTRQVHGAAVVPVGHLRWTLQDSPKADALITDRPGALLMQRFADCVPIFLAAVDGAAVGLAHAGWRGTVADVAGASVRALQQVYGISPTRLVAGIGPSIGPCCFEVGEEVAAEFSALPQVIGRWQTKPHVDLWEANRLHLMAAGLSPDAIEVSSICTRCNVGDYFSHRALGYPAGRFSGVIGLAS